MPKFYVHSGDFKAVIDRPETEAAALDALKQLEDKPVKRLSHITVVSEHGFTGDTTKEDDNIFTTLDLLEEIGLLGKFKPTDWV